MFKYFSIFLTYSQLHYVPPLMTRLGFIFFYLVEVEGPVKDTLVITKMLSCLVLFYEVLEVGWGTWIVMDWDSNSWSCYFQAESEQRRRRLFSGRLSRKVVRRHRLFRPRRARRRRHGHTLSEVRNLSLRHTTVDRFSLYHFSSFPVWLTAMITCKEFARNIWTLFKIKWSVVLRESRLA